MSCAEEFGMLEKALWKLIDGMVYDERLRHECDVHKIDERCKELVSKDWREEKESRKKEFSDAVTDLSRCIERAVKK
jgi:hypothetical protein